MENSGAAGKKAEEKDQSFMQRMGLGNLFGGNGEEETSVSRKSSKGSTKSSATSKKLVVEAKFEDLLIQKTKEKLELELEEIDLEAFLFEWEERRDQIAEELKNLGQEDEASSQELRDESNKLKKSVRELKTNIKKNQIKLKAVKDEIERLPQQQKLTQAIIEEDENDQQLSDNDESLTPPNSVKEWVAKVDPSAVPSKTPSEETNGALASLSRRLRELKEFPEDKMEQKEEELLSPPSMSPEMQQFSKAIADGIGQAMAMSTNVQAKQNPNYDKFMARQSTGKDLSFFSGRPEEWPGFIAEYENTTRICQYSNAENMQRLKKCLKGEAMKAVQCLMVSPENLPEVMETLKTRFGQAEHIIESMIAKVRSTPSIRDDQLSTVVELGTAVVNLAATIKSLKCDEHMKNPVLMKELKEKLTPTYKMQWMEWIEDNETRKENLEEFTTWIKRKLKTACKLVVPTIPSEKNKEEFQRKNNQFGGHGRRDVAVHVTQDKDQGERKCNVCDKNGHHTHQCYALKNAVPDERIKMVSDKKLCFSCLNPGHSSKKCEVRVKCGVANCNFFHHKLLHGGVIAAQQPRGQRVAQAQEQPPVNANEHVHHINATALRYVSVIAQGPDGEEAALALLDDGSSIFAIEEEVRIKIGASGPQVPICVKTVGGDGHHPNSQVISCKIKGNFDGSSSFQVDNVKTIEDLNLGRVTLDAEDLKRKFPHLKNVPLKSFFNVKPKMLIGSSHFELIEHLKVVRGKPGEPVAVKSRLGWSVIFPGAAGRMNVQRASSFHTCELDADDELHQLVKRSFATEEFGVKVTHDKPRSQEDKRALKIMEDSTVRGEDGIRFETGLLWKEDGVCLPESKTMALHRLMCQERKMDKDPQFAKAYCAKMQEYLEKDYIQLVEEEKMDPKYPKSWYLPHFGVMNPNKPGKLRLVFDAAAKSHGMSLNSALCQGPDLNNPLTSVLMKFRQYEYAFAGDIKDMFHRVWIRKEDRPSQRFLWRGMDRTMDPKVYEMKVMIFGATSSPSSAQFAKNLNASMQRNEYPEAHHAIISNFYVDDYLDSRSTEKEAEQLISDVINVQAKAGFEVCNWVSNSPNIIKSIKEELRAKELLELIKRLYLNKECTFG